MDLSEHYHRTPNVILSRAGLSLVSTRHGNFWNSFQTYYALEAPDALRDGMSFSILFLASNLTDSLISDQWKAKCKAAYSKLFPDGLSAELKSAREAAILEQLDSIAEDPDRTQSPASRMKSAIAEAWKVCDWDYHLCSNSNDCRLVISFL